MPRPHSAKISGGPRIFRHHGLRVFEASIPAAQRLRQILEHLDVIVAPIVAAAETDSAEMRRSAGEAKSLRTCGDFALEHWDEVRRPSSAWWTYI